MQDAHHRTTTHGMRAQRLSALRIAAFVGMTASMIPSHAVMAQEPSPVKIVIGKGHLLEFPMNLTRASVADPAVASVTILSPREVMLNGKSPGVTNLLVWNEQDQRQVFDVSVEADTTQLLALIQQVAPHDPIEVHAAEKTFVITGEVMSPSTIDEVQKAAAAYSPKVVTLLHVAEPMKDMMSRQVMLKVRFIEVNRTALQNLGFDIVADGQQFFLTATPGKTGVSFQGDLPFDKNTPFPRNLNYPDATDLFGLGQLTRNGKTIAQFTPHIQMREQKDLLRVLAEPNLLAKSGEEATFLAGGEIPIPLVTANTVQAVFKEFGVRMTFKPQVTERGTIILNVQPEVSSVDFSNAITSGGFKIPGFKTRRTQTTVELRSGETLVVGGLLSQETTKVAAKIPMVSDLPIVGDLFKSENFKKGETELLVLVSPSVVQPSDVIPTRPLQADPELAPFVKPGRMPYPDAQGERFRNLMGAQKDAIWEPEREADPFLKRSRDGGPFKSPGPLDYRPLDPTYPYYPGPGATRWTDDQPGVRDPEYYDTLQKYQLAAEDAGYSQVSGVLRNRLWSGRDVADRSDDGPLGSFWEQLGYRAPSW